MHTLLHRHRRLTSRLALKRLSNSTNIYPRCRYLRTKCRKKYLFDVFTSLKHVMCAVLNKLSQGTSDGRYRIVLVSKVLQVAWPEPQHKHGEPSCIQAYCFKCSFAAEALKPHGFTHNNGSINKNLELTNYHSHSHFHKN